MSVTHQHVSSQPDGSDSSLLQPSDWNADHAISLDAGDIPTHSHSGDDITSGTVADGRVASTIARDSEVTTAVSDHVAAADPHTEYVREASTDWVDLTDGGATTLHSHAGGADAPADADYLVGTANGSLSNEIVVGTSPGGELGGTWASPTVDATHAGSTHVALGTTPSTQAFGDVAAGGAATDAAKTDHKHAMMADPVTAHVAAGDPHTGYRLESADHSHQTTGLQAGTVSHAVLTSVTATDHHAAPVAGPDANVTVDSAGAAGTASTFARSGHGHQVVTDSGVASTQAFGDSATAGTSATIQRGSHKHAMPTLGYGLSGNSAPAVGLTSASAFATAETTISTATYADIAGASVSLAAGTWLVIGQVNARNANAIIQVFVAITHNDNTVISETAASRPASGTASLNSPVSAAIHAIVTPGSTTTYKLRGARGLTTHTGSWIAMDGNGVNTANHISNNSDKGTGIFAVRIA